MTRIKDEELLALVTSDENVNVVSTHYCDLSGMPDSAWDYQLTEGPTRWLGSEVTMCECGMQFAVAGRGEPRMLLGVGSNIFLL
jgi:hypothetical protein